MRAEEARRGEAYAVVVRMRPDLFAARGLRDVLWDVSEQTSTMAGSIFVPDRFWSQGINDQLFLGLRPEMGRLLDGLDASAYAQAAYLNPEHFLGTRLRALGLKPVAFPLEYLLTRGDQPDIHDVPDRWHRQQAIFWSGPAPAPAWSDAGPVLDRVLANVAIKNGQLAMTRCGTRDRTVEYAFARDDAGKSHLLMCEYKAPALFQLTLPGWMLACAPPALAAGVLRPRHGREVALRAYDAQQREVTLAPVPSTPGTAEAAAVRLRLVPSARSPLLAAARLGRSGLRAVTRLGRRVLPGA
jgi:hypothetical protein